MSPATIGSTGVALLLLAFGLNLSRVLHERHPLYLAMNIVGALLAAWYAFLSDAVPFVVLEVTWAVFALVRLMVQLKTASPEGPGKPS